MSGGIDVERTSRQLDFCAVQLISSASHRVIVYWHLIRDEVTLKCRDLVVVAYIAKTEGNEHLLEAIHAAATDTSDADRKWPARSTTAASSTGPPARREKRRSCTRGFRPKARGW